MAIMEWCRVTQEGEGGINVFAIAEIYNSSLWFVEKYLSVQSDHLPCNVHILKSLYVIFTSFDTFLAKSVVINCPL